MVVNIIFHSHIITIIDYYDNLLRSYTNKVLDYRDPKIQLYITRNYVKK